MSMRHVLVVMLLAACTHPAAPTTPVEPEPSTAEEQPPSQNAPAPRPPADDDNGIDCDIAHYPRPSVLPAECKDEDDRAPVETFDDATVIARTHDLFAAFDRNDRAALDQLVDPAFVKSGRRTYNLDLIAKAMTGANDHHAPAHTRSCSSERVIRGEHAILYSALCDITYPAHDDLPALSHPYFELVAWVPAGGEWRAVDYNSQDGGLAAEREAWNETFRTGTFFKTTANQHLIDSVKGRKPGAALDVAMGQGRNALYLASQGWKVTGIDISDEGIKLAQAKAAKDKLKITTVVTDNNTYDYGKAKWDLVTLIYAGSDHALIDKIKPSIKKGGLFVVEFFAKEATAGTGIGGFAPGELAALFGDGWKILTDVVVEDIADWGLDKTKVVRFTAQKL